MKMQVLEIFIYFKYVFKAATLYKYLYSVWNFSNRVHVFICQKKEKICGNISVSLCFHCHDEGSDLKLYHQLKDIIHSNMDWTYI